MKHEGLRLQPMSKLTLYRKLVQPVVENGHRMVHQLQIYRGDDGPRKRGKTADAPIEGQCVRRSYKHGNTWRQKYHRRKDPWDIAFIPKNRSEM